MKKFLALLFLLTCSVASAEERINVCYNYGCHQEALARFSEEQLQTIAAMLQSTSSAEEERKALSDAIGELYHWAGQQTPVNADKGGNWDDGGVEGEMDCIDHSTTTTRFLKMIEHRGMLKYHKVNDVMRRSRFFVFDHFSAVIEELALSSPALSVDDGMVERAKPRRYVVDSWFVDNGEPAVIMPLENWMRGASPKTKPAR
jgi:hypothetical protein